MKDLTLNRYEFLERKRAMDASWFVLLPFLLLFAGILWNSKMAPIPYVSLLKANLLFTGAYIALHFFMEKTNWDIRYLRWLTLLSFTLILLQITISIHFLGGTEAFLFYPLYLLPIVASGVLFSGWYPLGGALMSSGFLALLFLMESPAFGWYLVNLGLPPFLAAFEKVQVQHYPLFGFEPGPEVLFIILLGYLFVSLSFAFLAQSTGPLLDRLYRRAFSLEMDVKGREELFNLSIFHAPTGFVIGYCSNYQPIYINKSVVETFDLRETKGKNIFSLFHFDEEISRLLKEKIEKKELLDAKAVPVSMKDGLKAFFQIKLSFLDYPTPEGEERLFLLVINNITEELELSNIVMNSREAMILIDASGEIGFFNRAAADIFPNLAKGSFFREVLSVAEAFSPDLQKMILKGKAVDGKIQFREKIFFFSSFPLKDVTGVELGILVSLKDVTSEELFYNLSIKDELTGLYNRRYFFDVLEKEVAQAQRYPKSLSLAVIDIDFFKKINDTYGHQAGDRVLKVFSKTLSANLRKADVVARAGGEEFAIFMPFADGKGAADLCEKLRNKVEKMKPAFGTYIISVTCSIGVAEYQKGDGVDQLMAKADMALYEAKRSGRNRVVLFSEALVTAVGNP